MHRCLELARLGAGRVAPNPMVGAVLVHADRIIGEGYHQQYGKAHAEVNCIESVKEVELIERSTLYVSLEPCVHFGKTPPCADLVIAKGIPRVVVGCRDPFPEVDGKGIEKLRAAGVEVELGVLEAECIALNKRFFTFHLQHRPYVVLKWAQSADGKIAGVGAPAGGSNGGRGERTFISNAVTNRLVHRWRSEEASILVGSGTALADNPALTARLWDGGSDPIRLVIDRMLRLPGDLQLFDGKVRTIVFNEVRHEEGGMLGYYEVAADSSLVHQVIVGLHRLKIQSVLVEGGARLLQSFIDAGCWDEARVITNEELELSGGLPAPELRDAVAVSSDRLLNDTIRYYEHG